MQPPHRNPEGFDHKSNHQEHPQPVAAAKGRSNKKGAQPGLERLGAGKQPWPGTGLLCGCIKVRRERMVPGQAAAGTFRSAGAAESIAQEKWEQLRVQSLWDAPEKSVKRKREIQRPRPAEGTGGTANSFGAGRRQDQPRRERGSSPGTEPHRGDGAAMGAAEPSAACGRCSEAKLAQRSGFRKRAPPRAAKIG